MSLTFSFTGNYHMNIGLDFVLKKMAVGNTKLCLQ
ncbi:hypothetical protein KIPB_017245, partial [Kipferlia bialata]|eukprot:g17245.t1